MSAQTSATLLPTHAASASAPSIPAPVIPVPEQASPFETSSSKEKTVPTQSRVFNPKFTAPNLTKVVDITNNISLAQGSKFIIDVQPDMRNIVKTLAFHIIPTFDSLNLKDSAQCTPLSLTGYLLMSVYATLLHNDAVMRRPMSTYASEFMTSPLHHNLYTALMSMYVPKFITDIINGLFPTSDNRRPNIEFIPTLAGYSFAHDLGRMIIPSLFIAGHNIAATMSSRTQPLTVANTFFAHILLSINDIEYKIGQVLGTNFMVNNAVNNYRNWFNDAVNQLFNPVVMRTLQNRPFITSIDIYTPEFPDVYMNPYMLNLVADHDNISRIGTFVTSMSKFVEQHFEDSKPLKDVIASSSGANCMTHTVSILPLPTWKFHNTVVAAEDSTVTPTLKTVKDFAIFYPYLQPQKDKASKSPTIAIPPEIADAASKLIFPSLLALVSSDDPTKSVDPPFPELLFNQEDHVHPLVRYFDPTDTSTSKLFYTITTGIKIESFELDAFSVPVPNTDAPLSDENSLILQSAIPLKLIRNEISNGYNQIFNRTRIFKSFQPVSISLYDMSINLLGRLSNHFTPPIPTTLPMFTFFPNVRRLKSMFNRISYKIGETYPEVEPKLLVWSSYRYVLQAPNEFEDKVHMIASFRPIYGTNITLSQSEYPPTLIVL